MKDECIKKNLQKASLPGAKQFLGGLAWWSRRQIYLLHHRGPTLNPNI